MLQQGHSTGDQLGSQVPSNYVAPHVNTTDSCTTAELHQKASPQNQPNLTSLHEIPRSVTDTRLLPQTKYSHNFTSNASLPPTTTSTNYNSLASNHARPIVNGTIEVHPQASTLETRNFKVFQDAFHPSADLPSFINPFGEGVRTSFSGISSGMNLSQASRNNSVTSTLSASSNIWNDHSILNHRRTSSYQLGSPTDAVADFRSNRHDSVSPPSSISPVQPGFGNSPKQAAASRFFPSQIDEFHNNPSPGLLQHSYSNSGQYLPTMTIPEDQNFAGAANNGMISANGSLLSFPQQANQVYGNCFYDVGQNTFNGQYASPTRPYRAAPLTLPTGPRMAPPTIGYNGLPGPVDRRHSTGTSMMFGQQQPQARFNNALSERSPGQSVNRPVATTHYQQQSISPGMSSTTELYSQIKPYFTSDPFGKTAFLNSAKVVLDVDPQRAPGWISVSSSKLYIVLFKNFRAELFYVPEKCTTEYHVGDYVVVDADRGHDLGLVIKTNVTLEEAGLLKWRQQFESDTAMTNPLEIFATPYNANLSITTPKRIISMAQDNEVFQVFHKKKDETAAVLICNEKIREHKLDMKVMDCEYQWDRRKLTFFYSAKQRVDFRHLVSDIFKVYKTRIWMEAVHTEFPAFTREDFIGYYVPMSLPGGCEGNNLENLGYGQIASNQGSNLYSESDSRDVSGGVSINQRAGTQMHQRNASF